MEHLTILKHFIFGHEAHAQEVVTSISSITSFSTFVGYVIHLIKDTMIPVLLSAAVILFFYGVIKTFIFETDPQTIAKNKYYMLWGLGAIFVMLAIWGIINVLSSTLGIGLGGDISIPQFKVNP
jgi:hypothetical protein